MDGGDDFCDSEQHVTVSREETEKLFSICSLEEFIKLGRKESYGGLLSFLSENGIKFDLIGF